MTRDHGRDTFLSPHFTLSEMSFSETAVRWGLPNAPRPLHIEALTQLCATILEPAREALGPIHVNSAYRSPMVNEKVGGSVHSQHMRGEAADIVALAVPLVKLYQWLVANTPFDQAIYEFGSWVHVSCSVAPLKPRHMKLVSYRSSSGVVAYRAPLESDGLSPDDDPDAADDSGPA